MTPEERLRELAIRHAAFAWLDRERAAGHETFSQEDTSGLNLAGETIRLMPTQQGIWKPGQLGAALSFRTVYRPEGGLRPSLAIVVPSILFAIQHIWYAPTSDAAAAFVVAFFVWGVGSGLIYLRQRRLMPLVFAHGLVNLFFTLPALAVPFIPADLLTNGA